MQFTIEMINFGLLFQKGKCSFPTWWKIVAAGIYQTSGNREPAANAL